MINAINEQKTAIVALQGLYRGKKYQILFACFIVFLGFSSCIVCLKWRIKAWGWIQILCIIFGTFKIFTKPGPFHPLFITQILQEIQEKYQPIENIFIYICTYIYINIRTLDFFFEKWKRRAPKNDEDLSK